MRNLSKAMFKLWTPIENDVFQYQETIVPNTPTQEIENFQLQKTIEDLAKSPKKATFEIDNIG
jgi:hypothetical protein